MNAPNKLTQREYWNGEVGEDWVEEADLMDRTLAPLTAAALELLALQAGERVIDIGCGAGATTLAAAQKTGANCAVGVDISRPLLAHARKRAAERGLVAEFVEADAGAEALPGAPFDAAFSRFGVMFFDDPMGAFANIRHALKPGGRLVFVSWRPFAENLWTAAPLAALKPLLTKPVTPPDPNAPGPFALSERAKIETILSAAGWRDVAIAAWDGLVQIGDGGAAEAAKFLLKIGPSARAIAEQAADVDVAEAERVLTAFLAQHESNAGVRLPAACWMVRATA